MTVAEIIKRVRWCIDEETVNLAELNLDGADDNDDTYMDNIIKAKIDDALRWCLLYAPVEMLTQSSEWATSGIIVSEPTFASTESGTPAVIQLTPGFTRLIRVRMKNWSRAVRVPIEEDSDEYLALTDTTARATSDRPVAALIRSNPMRLELWPGGNTEGCEITYIQSPQYVIGADVLDNDNISIPSPLRPAFIYYIAFLVCSAYRESAATTMLEIAKMHIGLKE